MRGVVVAVEGDVGERVGRGADHALLQGAIQKIVVGLGGEASGDVVGRGLVARFVVAPLRDVFDGVRPLRQSVQVVVLVARLIAVGVGLGEFVAELVVGESLDVVL